MSERRYCPLVRPPRNQAGDGWSVEDLCEPKGGHPNVTLRGYGPNRGMQCTYNADGEFIKEDYDWISPKGERPDGSCDWGLFHHRLWIQHFLVDGLAWTLFRRTPSGPGNGRSAS